MSDKEKLIPLKIKLAVLLAEIQWYMLEDEFYETFPGTLSFIKGYF